MNTIFDTLSTFHSENEILIKVSSIILFAFLVNLILLFVVNFLAKKAQKTALTYDDIILKCVRKPASWLIWSIGVSFALEIVSDTQQTIYPYIPIFRSTSFIVLITWFLISFINQSEPVVINNTKENKSIDHTTFIAISRLIKVSVLIVSALMILQNLGMSISAVLAFGGVGGIAIGFAAKDLLANFFGGLMIFLDKPFSIGDWIRSPDREIEGVVEKINWRLSLIRTFDKRPIYIPNSIFNSIAIENPSRMTHRRIYETVGIRYEDGNKMSQIISEVEQMLKNHSQIDETQTLMVNFNQFAPSSLDFFIYTFTKTTNWEKYHQVKQDVLFKVMEIIEKNGAQIAFPTQTVHIEKNNPNDFLIKE